MTAAFSPLRPTIPKDAPAHPQPAPQAPQKHALMRKIAQVVRHIFFWLRARAPQIQDFFKNILKKPTHQKLQKVIRAVEERLFGKKEAPKKNVDRPILENLKVEMAKTGDRVEKFGQALRNLDVFEEQVLAEADNIDLTLKVSKVSAKLPSPKQEEIIEMANQAFGEELNNLRDFKNLIHKESGIAISQKTSDDAEQCAQAAALIKSALDAFVPPKEDDLASEAVVYLSTLTKIKQSFIDQGLYTEKDGDVEQILKLQAYLLSDPDVSGALALFVNQQGTRFEQFEATFNLDDFHGVILYHRFMNQFPLGVSLHKQLHQMFIEFAEGNLV